MKAIKNYESFKESLLSSTNGTMVESFDSSNIFNGCEYQSYRVYVDDVHYYNMFVIHNFSSNTYDVSLETSMSRVVNTQKAMIESVCRWCYYGYLNTKEISVDSEEYMDRCEETENADSASGNVTVEEIEGLDEHKEISDVENVCGDCSHFNVCMQGYETTASTCCMFDSLNKAINNPEWHHVSLATLANIDNNMLDDKRRLYLTVWGELNKTLKNLHKCNSGLSYERALSPLRRWVLELYHNKKITGNFKRYVYIKISMCNVECGVWTSAFEVATGQHESRKYNRATLRY